MPHDQQSMLGKGQVTPENLVLTLQKGFFYRLVRSLITLYEETTHKRQSESNEVPKIQFS
jgi:hypothetical protein